MSIILTYVGGVVCGAILAINVLVSLYQDSEQPIVHEYSRVMEECEVPLPRDQRCKIIAIPEVPK